MNESKQPYFTGNRQSQLYELDRVEFAFFQILINMGLPAQRTRDLNTNVTPRVELQMTTAVNQHYRHPLTGGTQSQFLPFNSWDFKLTATVVTNREQDGDSHLPLVGLTRWTMQMAQLLTLWTPLLCPTHVIIDIREDECPADVWNEGGLDTSAMTFSGMFSIRDSAW